MLAPFLDLARRDGETFRLPATPRVLKAPPASSRASAYLQDIRRMLTEPPSLELSDWKKPLGTCTALAEVLYTEAQEWSSIRVDLAGVMPRIAGAKHMCYTKEKLYMKLLRQIG